MKRSTFDMQSRQQICNAGARDQVRRHRQLPKAAPSEVASAILDGIEAGQEDIFPDPYAVDFGKKFGTSPKEAERQMAAMVAAMQSSG